MADEYRLAPRVNLQPGQLDNVFVFPVADPDRRNHQRLCLDAGLALLLCGALVAVPTALGSGPANNTTLAAFVGFLLWILGACLCLLGMALTPAAPWAVRAGAAVASAVLKCLLAPVPWP